MTRQACASRIESVLNKKTLSNRVKNFASEEAQVTFDDSKLPQPTLPKSLRNLLRREAENGRYIAAS